MAEEPDTRTWREGDLAYFTKLHYDRANYLGCEERPYRHGMETIRYYEMEGKARPCLIIQAGERGSFLVWCSTGQDKTDDENYIEVLGVQGEKLKKRSYLRKDHSEIRWIHRKLAAGWIGPQDKIEFARVLKEFVRMRLSVPAPGGPDGDDTTNPQASVIRG